jgi:hypothetical protein
MKKTRFTGTQIVSLFLFLSYSVFAQDSLPIAGSARAAYNKGTRDLNGQPGPRYWQNTTDYNLTINFNPSTRELKGTVDAVYFNNSPDTLQELWFKLYPNLYKTGSERKTQIEDADLGAGVEIVSISANGTVLPSNTYTIEGTNMRLAISQLAPHKNLQLRIVYRYILNKGSNVRTGQVAKNSFFIAYFFPRITVYDDVDGWNKLPYSGMEEFYNDFGNFRTAITVPKDFVVWATGDLVNARDVLNKKFVQRINVAASSDKVTDIIDTTDLKAGRITRQKELNTWIFEAKNVTDFAFALSKEYIWKSSSVRVDSITQRRTLVNAVFNPVHQDFYEVVDFTRKTVYAMSFQFPKWPFPFAHETIFNGYDDEMEYPMMANDHSVGKRENAITTTTHEVFHALFPFYVGTNETKTGWMDEGWAFMGECIIAALIDSSITDVYGLAEYADSSGTKDDTPIMTPTPSLTENGYGYNTYTKPAMALFYLKDYLGDSLFLKAVHHYIRQWNGKHPIPYDFFFSMNQGAGENLDWFWKKFFFDDGIIDLAIHSVARQRDGYLIQIRNKSNKPLPIDLTITYTDGSIQPLHQNIGVWKKGNSITAITLPTDKKLQKITLGSAYVPDKDKRDNVWIAHNHD